MRAFTQRAVAVIASIPEGKVMTYGQIAALAGSPRGARQVVRILHAMSKKHQLPWHRVINGKGKIGLQDEVSHAVQKMQLEAEGVFVSEDGAIDLATFQFFPAQMPELSLQDWDRE